MPVFFDELVAAGHGVLDAVDQRRLERASESAKVAIELYSAWLDGTLPAGTDDWAIGRDRHDAMVALRAFDGLDADAILELGWERLHEARAARAAAAREIDPDADEATVIDRVKSDVPATFDAALDAYRAAMARARRFLIDRDLVTVPDDERIDVVATPEYLRNVLPFAAYFEPAAFDRDPEGDLRRDPVGRRRPECHARAQLRVDQQHQHPRGVPGASPPARHRPPPSVADPDAGRRPGVRRGLGDVLRADDARAGLRHRAALPAGHAHRRHLASLPDHPRRPDAPRRADRRGGHGLPGRAHQLRAAQRLRRDPVVHVPARPTRCRTCSAGHSCSTCGPTSNAVWASDSA